MNFYTEIISKRGLNGQPSLSKINIKGNKTIEDLLPTDNQMTEWAFESLRRYELNIPQELIHIKVKEDLYLDILKQLYFRVGKSIEREEGTQFKISLKKGKSSFFENISSIILYSEELRCETIVIHV